ncbi:MAG TPA: regulatory iron-sulfur-containing complex subunit RicT [Sedimentisphaerales bacterium]|nr:regulatory iron-sulfur-containing complex subunit RicT [Sedimentisphaerales bacterium]
MTEETPSKPKTAKRKFLLIRYGRMNNLGLFEHNESEIPRTLTRVVVKTDKGLELGHLVGQLDHYKDGRFRLSEEQIASYYTTSEIQFNTEPVGKVVRLATPDDISEEQHLKAITAEEIESCERLADELGLRMKIIDAEHIFGGERIVFYFMAEGRVDFRELVRKLAQEYQTRIEMRQIGSRDEAKLLGDVESCGRECCCLQFLQLLKPVNMRMAKMQKATLDPSKISGYCGRLKCCLRYEDQTYTELKQSLPKKGVLVQTEKGEGKVLDGQILTQMVIVEFPNGERAPFPVDAITVLPASAIKRKPPEGSGPDANRRPEEGDRPAGRDSQRRPGRDRDQRRPPRDDRREAHDQRQDTPTEPQDASDERPEASEGQPSGSDRDRESPDRESPNAELRPENSQRPTNRDSQRRPGRDRDQRRPPRNGRREGGDSRSENRNGPREVREPRSDAPVERPESPDVQQAGPEPDRDNRGQERLDAGPGVENADKQE